MSANVKVIKQIAISSVTNKQSCLSTDTQVEITKVIDLLSPLIPIPLNEDYQDPVYKFKGISVDKLNLSVSTKKRIEKLHDGSFIVMNSDSELIHYNSDFTLKGTLPFEFKAVVDPGDYYNPNDIAVCNYTIPTPSETGTILAVSIPSAHIVQLYKYTSNVWTYIQTIGTIGAANYTTNHLSSPLAVSLYWGAIPTSDTGLNLFVSNSGPNALPTNSFIKRFQSNLSFSSITEEIVSFPKQVIALTGVNNGSLLHNETDTIIKMRAISPNEIYVASNAKKEFGLLDVTDVLNPIAKKIVKGDLKDLAYNDTLKNPIAFRLGSSMIIGDELGHLSVFDVNFNPVFTVFKNKPLSVLTEYPFEFESIDDIFIDSNIVYFLSGGDIYKTNILDITSQEIVYKIPMLSYPYKVNSIYGVPDYCLVTFSLNGTDYYAINEMEHRVVDAITRLEVKISLPKENIINKVIDETIEPLLLIEI